MFCVKSRAVKLMH